MNPLEAIVDNITEDFYATLGAYTKALMSSQGHLSPGLSKFPDIRSQLDYLYNSGEEHHWSRPPW